MDSAYQRSLFSEWLKINDVTVDYDRLCRLDEKVEEVLINREEEDVRYRRWCIKNLWLDNFLSFGNGNNVDYQSHANLRP